MISSETAKILQELIDDPSNGTNLPEKYSAERLAKMRQNGLISQSGWFESSISYKITESGRDALSLFRDSQKQSRRTRRNEWIRWIITTVIALAAFLKSFFFTS